MRSSLAARKTTAFTLIELLIVVAIIAILAAIAVPNFLEAQTRAKVTRARSDMRTIATALEAYSIDYTTYPRSNTSSRSFCPPSVCGNTGFKPTLERLTTPIAFITGGNTFQDPFKAEFTYQGITINNVVPLGNYAPEDRESFHTYWYMARSTDNASIWDDNDLKPQWWFLTSAGPDLHHHNIGTALNAMTVVNAGTLGLANRAIYDPTNGTVSRGSLWRVGGEPTNPGLALARAIESANR